MRLILTFALLFIAPSAWGQTQSELIFEGDIPPQPRIEPRLTINADGVITSIAWPTCDYGWSLVMDDGGKPQCAWVLKEPIYK